MSDAAGALKALINVCEDGIAGYDTVIAEISDPATRWILVEIADQRRQFAKQLANLVIGHGYGTDADEEGTLRGAVHQAWIDLRSTLGTDDAAMLFECLRGEDAAIRAYSDALDADLPDDAAKVVQTQLEQLRTVRDQIEQLRERAQPTPD